MWHRLVRAESLLVALAIGAGSGAAPGVAAQTGTATPTAGFIGLPDGISAWRVSEFTQAPSLSRVQFAMMNPTDPVIVDPNEPLG